ncbi:50S ribosomal protein L16 [Candidatus Nomurabacteria bacterium]|nr:50S ribosomal protein L16 [Candidatus Nomurabacteria bacterium]USN94778.1 MAG: 50S ribosomal protein L16 [Candidatus Nomurabacteria bacterium]
MLLPKKVKFRKWQTGRKSLDGKIATRGTAVSFGSFGLKATSPNRINSRQIEAARKVASRTVGKTGKVWIRIFPDRPFTKKAAEVPMGKGKGEPEGYCCEVLPGKILFEVDGVSDEIAKEALRKAGTKLPVKTKVIARN